MLIMHEAPESDMLGTHLGLGALVSAWLSSQTDLEILMSK